MSGFASAPSPAAQWRSVRRLYPIYSALAEKFGLGAPPFPDVDQLGNNLESNAIARLQQWLAEMDERIQPHQFRQMLQSTGLAQAEEKLDALVRRHLEKSSRGDADRDKLDFLLAQYVAVCAPPSFQTRELSLEEVAEVLEPVLGECPTYVPQWLEPLQRIIEQMEACTGLDEFESLNIFQRGRELKVAAGEKFFTSTALLAFTRFNYLARYTFAKLLAAEVQEIDNMLQQLQGHGGAYVDGSQAGFAPETPVESVRELLLALISSAAPAYSGDTPSKQVQLRLLRGAVEKALERYKTALSEADQVRFARLELEVEELRSDLDGLRELCEQLHAALAELQAERVATAPTEPMSLEPLPVESPASVPQASSEMSGATPTIADAAADPVAGSADVTQRVNELLDRIRKSVRVGGSRATGLLTIGNGTVLLSEGEVAVLQSNAEATDTVASAIEVAVGVRALLVEVCEDRKAGQEAEFRPLLQLATDVLQELQRLAATPNPRQETITGTARQLSNVMQYAEKTFHSMSQSSSHKDGCLAVEM